MQKETVESLLRKLMQDEDDSNLNVIYILAVMLERKRILVEKDVQTTDDARTIRVYEHRQTNEVFLVPDPHLRLDELEPVQQQVIDMLGSDKKEAAEEPVDEEAPTADSINTDDSGDGLKGGFYSKTD